MNQKLLRKYAELAIKTGVNIQPGQLLRIQCPIETAEFGRLCTIAAYEAGARLVKLDFNDELLSKIHYELAATEVLCEFPKYKEEEMNFTIDSQAALLSIYAETPGLLKDIDPEKLQRVMVEYSKNTKPMHDYVMSGTSQWSVVSLPTAGWARKVYPDLSESEAVAKLWETILYTVRIDADSDAQKNWRLHNEVMLRRNKIMNDYNFDYLTFKNGMGTDLKVHLARNHSWAGGCERTPEGVVFNPNIPTEECFCMPYKTKVDGKVAATKPLNYQGKLIEDFYLVFQDGKVVDYDAKKEKEALKNIIEFDEGSSYLGEVALISHDSPISNTGLVFFNTLFDENASCHLALGAAYPMNLHDYTCLSEEEMLERGYNKSLAHVDFMFGSADMEITGYTFDKTKIQIFKDGDFVF